MLPTPALWSTGTFDILLVDDQPEFLELAREALGSHPRLRVVGQAASGEEALALLAAVDPEAVVLDVQMPGMNGFEAAQRLLEARPGLLVVMISASDEAEYRRLAWEAGAVAFLHKRDVQPQLLVETLDRSR